MRYLIAIAALLALPCHALTVTLSNGASCTYSQIETGAGGNLAVTCSAGTTTPPPSPTPAPTPTPTPIGCPAAPAGMLTASFPDLGVWFPQRQLSGQVLSMPLPKVAAGHHSGQIVLGENAGAAFTPQPVTVEITISKCPGFIDTDTANPTATHPNGNYCNLRSPNGTYNSITWFGAAFSTLTDAASANRLGYCWAGEAEGPWYFNARWTYAACPLGQSTCGFAIQQNLGPY